MNRLEEIQLGAVAQKFDALIADRAARRDYKGAQRRAEVDSRRCWNRPVRVRTKPKATKKERRRMRREAAELRRRPAQVVAEATAVLERAAAER